MKPTIKPGTRCKCRDRLIAWGAVIVLLSMVCTLGCAHGVRPVMDSQAATDSLTFHYGPGYQP